VPCRIPDLKARLGRHGGVAGRGRADLVRRPRPIPVGRTQALERRGRSSVERANCQPSYCQCYFQRKKEKEKVIAVYFLESKIGNFARSNFRMAARKIATFALG
jgi:hypothetical protein